MAWAHLQAAFYFYSPTYQLPNPQQAGSDVLAGSLPHVCDHCTVKITWSRLMETTSCLYYIRNVIVTDKKGQEATKK